MDMVNHRFQCKPRKVHSIQSEVLKIFFRKVEIEALEKEIGLKKEVQKA